MEDEYDDDIEEYEDDSYNEPEPMVTNFDKEIDFWLR